FTVVNVADRADIDVRFGAFKLCLCHGGALLIEGPQRGPEPYLAGDVLGSGGKIKRDLRLGAT
ncbi:hypothetical protein, partial [Sulfitobacter sp. 1A15299]|uniref:hypothetical protein n=1 Tax=Sulfitobacter sp. 1A15299 TaxID=3368598 RepID=UPI00374683CC